MRRQLDLIRCALTEVGGTISAQQEPCGCVSDKLRKSTALRPVFHLRWFQFLCCLFIGLGTYCQAQTYWGVAWIDGATLVGLDARPIVGKVGTHMQLYASPVGCAAGYDKKGRPFPDGSTPGSMSSSNVAVARGQLPQGLNLRSNGDIDGTPEKPGNFSTLLFFKNLTCHTSSEGKHGFTPLDLPDPRKGSYEIRFTIQP